MGTHETGAFIHLADKPSETLFVCLFVCLLVCLFVGLFVCLLVYWFIGLLVWVPRNVHVCGTMAFTLMPPLLCSALLSSPLLSSPPPL